MSNSDCGGSRRRPTELPELQTAVQLSGPDTLAVNTRKPVHRPAAHQVLCRVEAVCLCFSDLKLIKQFSDHARKSEVVSGISPSVLAEMPSYVPGAAATVPGHEAVVRVVEAGDLDRPLPVGNRYLVQTDYRWLPTEDANAAFGYNFEGGLQEYVLMDERVTTSPDGDSMLIPAPDELSASAVALIEPWACVEAAYSTSERRSLKPGGRCLVVADRGAQLSGLGELLEAADPPGSLTWVGEEPPPPWLPSWETRASAIAALGQVEFDDIVYLGSSPDTVEQLFAFLALGGLLLLALGGGQFGRAVRVPVGRVHYRGIRIAGTAGHRPLDAARAIPETSEIPPHARVSVVGAGGPMGIMHVVRALSSAVPGIEVVGSDIDEARLQALSAIASPLAEAVGLTFRAAMPASESDRSSFDYAALMVPAPDLVQEAIEHCRDHAVINIFAGIPLDVSAALDLDSYVRKQCYLVGTSGSTLADMRTVLRKVAAGELDTNRSVAAVGGLEAAIEGIRAIERREIAGKIVLYPTCRGLALTPLAELRELLPAARREMGGGVWNRHAEEALLQHCAQDK